MPDSQGQLIIFDGIDGTGKTTQIELVKKALSKTHYDVVSIRYLGGTPIGEAIREVYLSSIERPPETTVYMASAIQAALIPHIDQEKSDGKIILMDRGPLSLAAYQIIGDSMDKSFSSYVDEGISLLAPDLIILYDLDPKIALERKNSLKKDYFESRPLEYFDLVRQAYLDVAKQYSNVEIISASGNISSVHEQTLNAISKVLTS